MHLLQKPVTWYFRTGAYSIRHDHWFQEIVLHSHWISYKCIMF